MGGGGAYLNEMERRPSSRAFPRRCGCVRSNIDGLVHYPVPKYLGLSSAASTAKRCRREGDSAITSHIEVCDKRGVCWQGNANGPSSGTIKSAGALEMAGDWTMLGGCLRGVLTFRSMIATVMVMREIPWPVSATHGPHAQSEACAYGSHRSWKMRSDKEARAVTRSEHLQRVGWVGLFRVARDHATVNQGGKRE